MIHTEYYKDGTPCECGIKKRYFGYYASGALAWEVPYVNGKKHGLEKEYYESGALAWEVPYVNGKKNGVYKEYYESGALKWEIPYVNDKRHGMQKRYYESGALCDEFLWIDGCCVCLHCSAENFL